MMDIFKIKILNIISLPRNYEIHNSDMLKINSLPDDIRCAIQ